MKRYYLAILSLFLLFGCSTSSNELTIYSGRSQSLVDPLVEQFQEETGITVNVRYGETAQLAVQLLEEGDRSPADLFWAQDAGALSQVAQEGLFEELPEWLTTSMPEAFRHDDRLWIATSGRARVLAYDTREVDEAELPASVLDLTDPEWNGRVGWAPTNGSFQAFVTAMRVEHGDDRTRQWLEDMQANGARPYGGNTPIIEALAAGEIALGLPNHYYLLRFKATDENYPVGQTFFEPGDVGNLVNIAGAGILNSSENSEAAVRFIEYLLSETGQAYFTQQVYEYPVTQGVEPHAELVSFDELLELSPGIDLNRLDDLEATLGLLREVGLL